MPASTSTLKWNQYFYKQSSQLKSKTYLDKLFFLIVQVYRIAMLPYVNKEFEPFITVKFADLIATFTEIGGGGKENRNYIFEKPLQEICFKLKCCGIQGNIS